jgi:hypothetical protein
MKIAHADIVRGGKLTLKMGFTPNVVQFVRLLRLDRATRRAIERGGRDSQRLGFEHRQFPLGHWQGLEEQSERGSRS